MVTQHLPRTLFILSLHLIVCPTAKVQAIKAFRVVIDGKCLGKFYRGSCGLQEVGEAGPGGGGGGGSIFGSSDWALFGTNIEGWTCDSRSDKTRDLKKKKPTANICHCEWSINLTSGATKEEVDRSPRRWQIEICTDVFLNRWANLCILLNGQFPRNRKFTLTLSLSLNLTHLRYLFLCSCLRWLIRQWVSCALNCC